MKLAIAVPPSCRGAGSALCRWLTHSNYIIGIALSACIFTVAAAALNLVYGYTGLLSFAQLGFWGIGGYASALTVMTFGGNFWQGLSVGGANQRRASRLRSAIPRCAPTATPS